MNSLRLPLFPLSLVLFPGTTVPLHLFEPRYRQLLKDVEAGDRRFGIICPARVNGENEVPAGRVGCIAEVVDVETLPDGRSNIMVAGRERFALDRVLEDPAPYLVGEVTLVEDLPDGPPVALSLAADELASDFRRVVRAVHTLNETAMVVPALPDEPAQLAWSIAAMIDLDLDARQRLLGEHLPSARLATIDGVLRNALPDLELRAAMLKPA